MGNVQLTDFKGATVTVTISPVLRVRIWIALVFIWCAVLLLGADELRVSTKDQEATGGTN